MQSTTAITSIVVAFSHESKNSVIARRFSESPKQSKQIKWIATKIRYAHFLAMTIYGD